MKGLPRRAYKWVAIGVVLLLLVGWLLISPASAGRAAKSTYHAMPRPVKAMVPDSFEQVMGRGVDGVTRFFAFGNSHRLIELDVRLEKATWAPGAWSKDHTLNLEWTDVGDDVSYELRAGHSETPTNALDVPMGTFDAPRATLELPGDGDWYIRVKPKVGSDAGRTTTFGPFRIDSTPPPAPQLEDILPPPGYSFSLSWSSVADTSGISHYEVQRRATPTGLFQTVATTDLRTHTEDQLGNGQYTYRIRAVNGAGAISLPSNSEDVNVRESMTNPGAGSFLYGIHANYTSFMRLWDISDPDRYATVNQVPDDIADEYLGGGYGFDIDNQTLVQRAKQLVGSETNTLTIAEKLFVWLFDHADYDSKKLTATQGGDGGGLQSASQTYDRKRGICGDLATLYITMLRIAGVPARPVHGYLDNPGAGIGDFHVWVEVWVGASVKQNGDARDDWMTVDVSGISGPFDPEAFLVYFGIFNPEYLALGLNADYADSSWNAWAQFGWSTSGGTNPVFSAMGRPVELSFETKNLYFNADTKERALVADGHDPPPGFNMFFPDVKVLSKKRIDYGVNLNGTKPMNATMRIRYPVADAFANVLPWQSVIYTIYTNSPTVQKAPGKAYTSIDDQLGYVVWEDDYRL